MREWCSCGAAIRASRKQVALWRTSHRHDAKDDPQPEPQGAFAQAENAGPRRFEYGEFDGYQDFPVVNARVGFRPNGEQ